MGENSFEEKVKLSKKHFEEMDKMNKNNLLSNNLKGKEGYEFNNNTYLLYEGKLNELSTTDIDIGMWIDYEQTNNENMNSAFIGTIKVYIE